MAVARSNEEVAWEFWEGTELASRFPRDIEKAVALKLPMALVKLPRVTVPAVRQWLKTRRLLANVPNDGRELMGCLVAYRGFGIVFICGADPIDEQRLTIAHETGHFLRDYLLPRQEVLDALGDGMADVLDGKRLPTLAERANAVLVHVRLGAHVHLLPRDGQDENTDLAVAEEGAHTLGLELVAPRQGIFRLIYSMRKTNPVAGDICAGLSKHFGLPQHVF